MMLAGIFRLATLPTVIAAAVLTLAAPARAADSAADARALARAEQFIAGIKSARGGFTQQLRDGTGRILQRAEGTLYLQKPGLFRWEYTQPAGQLIVADGRNLWLYDAELEQVTVRPAGKALASSPAMLLAGTGRVADGFIVSDGGRQRDLDWIVLTPRVADGDFQRVRLGFTGRELRAMELDDRLRQVTALEFPSLERNPRLAPTLFRFTPPAGVDVVGAPAKP